MPEWRWYENEDVPALGTCADCASRRTQIQGFRLEENGAGGSVRWRERTQRIRMHRGRTVTPSPDVQDLKATLC